MGLSDPELKPREVSCLAGRYSANAEVFDALDLFLANDLKAYPIRVATHHSDKTWIYHLRNCTTVLGYTSYSGLVLSRSEEVKLSVIGNQLEREELFGILERKIIEVGGKPKIMQEEFDDSNWKCNL